MTKNRSAATDLVSKLELLEHKINHLELLIEARDAKIRCLEQQVESIEQRLIDPSSKMTVPQWDEVDPKRMTESWLREQGRIIRSVRKQRGLTLEDLEKVVTISKSTLSRIEQGAAVVDLDALEAILQALNYPKESFHMQVLRGLEPSSRDALRSKMLETASRSPQIAQ